MSSFRVIWLAKDATADERVLVANLYSLGLGNNSRVRLT